MEQFDDQILSFFSNDLFMAWVYHPDDQSMAYWEGWLVENPDQAENLQKARQIALQLKDAQRPPHTEKLAADIWQGILAGTGQEPQSVLIPWYSGRIFLKAAASMAALLLLVTAAYYLVGKKNLLSKSPTPQSVAAVLENNVLKHTNGTAQNQVVYLVDGTKVTLQPGSSIKHTVFLQKDKREVFLEGDGFFEVAKDAKRPFYVFAHDIVLRVLGTSFNVTTNKHNGNITVIVKTGRVSVYKKTNPGRAEYILTPNQRILYSAQTQSIIKSELDSAKIQINVKPLGHDIAFNFEEMPVAKIFATLQEAYGIRINYNEPLFSRCVVTTSLTDEVFEEKLKIICEAIGSTYRIENNQVYIEGNGCR